MNTILFHICFWLMVVAFIVISYLVIKNEFNKTSPGRNVRRNPLETGEWIDVDTREWGMYNPSHGTAIIGGSGNRIRRRSAVYIKEPIKPIKCMGKHNFI